MKKFVTVLTAALCAVICAFAFTACKQTEEVIEAESVTLNVNQIALLEGDSYTLEATVTPENATNKTVEWTSSDYDIAKVDNGVVTAVSQGVATITATTANGKTAECTVTVDNSLPITTVTVTLYAQGGEFEDGKDTCEVYVEQYGKLPTVTVTRGSDYVFTGWYTDEYRTHEWDSDEELVNDEKLYAGWRYLNKYGTVTDALAGRVKTEHETDEVKILMVYSVDGYLCFVASDDTGAFAYKTDIGVTGKVAGNAQIVSAIPSATLTLIKNYNDTYNSVNNSYVADCMAFKYTKAQDANESIIYSCVSDYEEYSEGKFSTNGPWYAWLVRAIVADADGKVYDYSFKAVAGVTDVNAVIGGHALSEEVELQEVELDDIAADFYAEFLKEIEA